MLQCYIMKKKQKIIRISEDFHKKIKQKALDTDMTISEYVENILNKVLKNEYLQYLQKKVKGP